MRAAGLVSAGLALSSVTGLVTQMLVSRTFGTSAELDAFYAANRLSEILFNLMSGGALASAFIPTFAGYLTREDRSGAWRLASSIANLLLLTFSVVCAAAWIFAPWLVRHVIAPGFEDPTQIRLTVDLLRVQLLSATIFGVSGLLMGVLNAHQHFALPALAPAFYRLGWILGVLLLAPSMGIFGLAWGVVLGASMHLAIQLPGLRGRGAKYFPDLGLRDAGVRQVGRLMGPRVLGVAVVQLNFLVNTIIASGQPEGSLTGITLAFSLMLMPQIVIAQAIAIAALPTFSEHVARGEYAQMRRSLGNSLRGVVFLSVPASIGLLILRRPLVALLLQGGAFDAQSTRLVAWALLWYGLGLVGHALVEIVSRAFYALKDTRTPVLVGGIAMALNVVFSLTFPGMFQRIGWMPHGGLALANSLATALESGALLWLMRSRLEGLEWTRLRRGVLGSLISGIALVITLWGWRYLTEGGGVWLIAGGGVVLGGVAYWVTALCIRVPDAREIPAMLFSQ
jgi:putative peptidoglycan lipid II flippase